MNNRNINNDYHFGDDLMSTRLSNLLQILDKNDYLLLYLLIDCARLKDTDSFFLPKSLPES